VPSVILCLPPLHASHKQRGPFEDEQSMILIIECTYTSITWGSHEKRIANDIIHDISRDIVNQAINTNAPTILGDIKHLLRRKQNTQGRKFNRKLSGFQYYKLTQYITYKAALAGIKVIQVSEASTSQYCRKCSQKGARKIQGLFTCAKCGEENADRNAAFNIAYRPLGYISKVGVTVNRNAMMTKEATYLNRW